MVKKKTLVWLIVLFAGIFAVQDGHYADAAESDKAYAISLINEIRQDPLGYAESLGYDLYILQNQLPWIWMSGAANGLAAVTASEVLMQRAEHENTAGISNNNIISIIDSCAGDKSQVDITMNTDYATQGNISGVISFNNFIKPSVAIRAVINYQLKKELYHGYNGKRILLSPAYKQIGVSVCSGRIQQEYGTMNAYLIYITLSSALLKSEVQVVNMINQLRYDPGQAYKYLPRTMNFLPGGYSPLFFNDALDQTAKIVLYYGVDVQAYALHFGFPQPALGYTAILETFWGADDDSLAMEIFSSLLTREAAAYPQRDVLFSPSWNEVGTGLYKINNASFNSVKLSMVTGQSGTSTNGFFRIYGVTYADQDLNGVYTPGEEVVERLVTAYNSSTGMKLQTVFTNQAGQFTFRLPCYGEYTIETINNGIRTEQLVVLNNDRYLPLSIQQ